MRKHCKTNQGQDFEALFDVGKRYGESFGHAAENRGVDVEWSIRCTKD
jgi:hypothetical protein